MDDRFYMTLRARIELLAWLLFNARSRRAEVGRG